MKYIQDRIRGIFKLNDSPNQLAAAFAVGIFIAFSPTIGLHTVSCLVVAWVFRLNKLVVFTAAFVMNPWTMVPIYGFCLWFGMKMTGAGSSIPAISWNELTIGNAFMVLKPYLWPFVAGTLLIGTVAALASYALVYRAVLRIRKKDAVLGPPEPTGDSEPDASATGVVPDDKKAGPAGTSPHHPPMQGEGKGNRSTE